MNENFCRICGNKGKGQPVDYDWYPWRGGSKYDKNGFLVSSGFKTTFNRHFHYICSEGHKYCALKNPIGGEVFRKHGKYEYVFYCDISKSKEPTDKILFGRGPILLDNFRFNFEEYIKALKKIKNDKVIIF